MTLRLFGRQFGVEQFLDHEPVVNRRPLRDVEVVFLPDPQTGTLGRASSSYTDAKVRYRLRTYKGQSGAVIGTHRIYIRDLTALPLPPLFGEVDTELSPRRYRRKDVGGTTKHT